jgi:hypothetical protein
MNRIGLVLLLAVTACTEPMRPIVWYKVGMTGDGVKRDNYDCVKESIDYGTVVASGLTAGRTPSVPMYIGCMQAKGYEGAQQ